MLTERSISDIMNGRSCEEFQPLVQILKVEKTEKGFFLEISDGRESFKALYLGSDHAEKLNLQLIDEFFLIILSDFCLNLELKENPLIVFEFQLRFNSGYRYGRPTPFGAAKKNNFALRIKQETQNEHACDINGSIKELEEESIPQTNHRYFPSLISPYLTRYEQQAIKREEIIKKLDQNSDSKIPAVTDTPLDKSAALEESRPRKINFAVSQNFVSNQAPLTKKPIELTTIAQIFNVNFDPSEVYKQKFSVLCTIGKLSLTETENLWYRGCSNDRCSRKLLQNHDGRYYCQGCKVFHKDFTYRYRVLLPIHDSTGSLRVKVFDKYAQNLLGVTAQQLNIYKNLNNNKAEATFMNIFGKRIIAVIQVTLEKDGRRDLVLCSARPADDAFDSLLQDIAYIYSLVTEYE